MREEKRVSAHFCEYRQTERKRAREDTTNKSARALYFSMDYVDDICERVSWPIQNLIGIIP